MGNCSKLLFYNNEKGVWRMKIKRLINNTHFKPIPEKYLLTTENKNEIKYFFNRLLKAIIFITLIYFSRKFVRENKQAHDMANELFTSIDPVFIVRFFAVNNIGLGVIIGSICFLFWGFNLLKKKILVWALIFTLIDSTILYIYPEIPAAIFKAIYLDT
jgi:hypothetical protein